MNFVEFARLAAPVMFANILTIGFVYGMATLARRQRNGTDVELGAGVCFLLILLPLMFMLYGLYLWGGFEATPLRHFFENPVKPPVVQLIPPQGTLGSPEGSP